MKYPLYSSKLFILLILGLAAMVVFSLWRGSETRGGAGNAGLTGRPSARAGTGEGRGGHAEYRSARREITRSNNPLNAPAGVSSAHSDSVLGPSQIKRSNSADNAILRRAGARSGSQGKASRHGSGSGAFSLRDILTSASLTPRQRAVALESLRQTSSLSEEDRAAAQDYLVNGVSPEGLAPGQHHWIVDELITTLRADGADSSALSHVLAGVFSNKKQHMVVRDYALQHLGHLQHEGGDSAIIAKTLATAIREKQGTIAGTALLALHQNKDNHQAGEAALSVASDKDADIRSRITALQVAGKQGYAEALPLAVETASDSSQPIVLRMAAIATLADLKAAGQEPLLQQLSQSRDARLRTAAKAALTKVNAE